MSKNPPKRSEQITADLERWQLEMAEELGIIEEVRQTNYSLGARPVLRSVHGRPTDKSKKHVAPHT